MVMTGGRIWTKYHFYQQVAKNTPVMAAAGGYGAFYESAAAPFFFSRLLSAGWEMPSRRQASD